MHTYLSERLTFGMVSDPTQMRGGSWGLTILVWGMPGCMIA
jgi:hypothetical protein